MKVFGLAVAVMSLALSGNLAAQEWPAYGEYPPDEPQVVRVQYMAGSGSFLGVGVAEINAERAKALKLKEVRGVEITAVTENSPAAKAGLKVGDVVLEYNGERVEGVEQFMRMVRETPPDRQVKLQISRDGVVQTIAATIGTRKDSWFYGAPNMDMERLQRDLDRAGANLKGLRLPDIPRPYIAFQSGGLGVEAEALSGQLADYFGVKDGVLVRSVLKDSVAEKAGLKAGDVITKVDDANVTTPREITRALRSKASQKTLPVTVVRNHKEMTVSVTLEADKSQGEIPRRIRTVGTDMHL